ncbi:MAG: DUF5674 family protein [Anaerolineae bacterium]
MIVIIRQPATAEQLAHMSQAFGSSFIKLAVDVEREILAGGGELHKLIVRPRCWKMAASKPVWGADWYPLIGKLALVSH